MNRAPDPSVVLVDGPWEHRDVSANGCRFHVASLGEGPLVLLLHGFPEFWWSWRHQLVGLAEAGFRAVAVDLRGYGASDKPPRGYDGYTLAADVAGLVRALGESSAVIVGHDWGGVLGWWVASTHPALVDKLVVLSVPHPLRMREAMLSEPRGQLRSSSYVLRFQVPGKPERELVEHDAAEVGNLLHSWGGPGFPSAEEESRCREAMQIPLAAHSAMEYYRWAVRSNLRPSGVRFHRALRRPITAPTLQVHGALDRCVRPQSALGSGRYVLGAYEWRLLDAVGHFPHEEVPDLITGDIVRWAKT